LREKHKKQHSQNDAACYREHGVSSFQVDSGQCTAATTAGFFTEASAGHRSHQEAPHAAGEPSPQISALTVPKKYAAGLEISRPGGACLKLGR
jgi:hypothetical protein